MIIVVQKLKEQYRVLGFENLIKSEPLEQVFLKGVIEYFKAQNLKDLNTFAPTPANQDKIKDAIKGQNFKFLTRSYNENGSIKQVVTKIRNIELLVDAFCPEKKL